ncbi:MAG: hypothetical protein JWO32_738 [Bacteroidetes bacterium]|nr:hypothetical protein [Bacteroidota bacterium]
MRKHIDNSLNLITVKKLFSALIGFLTTFLMCGQTASPEYYTFIKKADSLYKIKDYKNSALTYSSAFKTLGGKGKVKDRYNAARSWALANTPDSAFYNLHRIADRTFYSDYVRITNEEDFNSLHKDKRWNSLLTLIKQNKYFNVTMWLKSETKGNSYTIKLQKDSLRDGKLSATIQSVKKKFNGQGTFLQFFEPEEYLGKRIRLTGNIKSKDVTGWASFWLRIDGPDTPKTLSFDDMRDRALKGTSDWKKFEIVLDVPKQATNLVFGALLNGAGQMWFNDLNFEIVDISVPLTGQKIKQ